MHFTCSQNELSKAITTVSHAISKVQQTVLDGILFEAREDRVVLRATDRNLSITTWIPAGVEQDGRAVIPAKVLQDFVNRLPDSQTTVQTISDRMAEISALTAKGRLQLMNDAEFPLFPDIKKENAVHVPADQLAEMITRTIFSASTSEDRPVLTGLLFDLQPEMLRLVAVDGFRMAVREEPVVSETTGKFIIPARALREVSRILNGAAELKIYFDQGRVLFESENTQVVAQLLEGQFVPYESYFPKSYSTHVQADRDALRDSLERALIIANQGMATPVVQFQLSDNVLDIRADGQTANSTEPIPVIMRGDDIKISLNARFLLDVLKSIDESEVTMTFNTPTTPCVVERTGLQAYHYLILPVLTHSA